MASCDTKRWNPFGSKFPPQFSFGSYALIVLNLPIRLPPVVMSDLWEGAVFRSTIDGGTDRWFNFLKESKAEVNKRFPELVSGDFDSIKQETLSSCRDNGCEIVETPDQDYTDFEKGLKTLISRCKSHLDSVVVICESSGRIDQTFSNINTLRLGPELDGSPSLYLLSRESLMWHLSRGKHIINIPHQLRDRHEWCGILPFEPKENNITTTGLRWNLTSHSIKFGGLISSSNTYESDVVTVDTDAELIWSMGLVWDSIS